MVLVIAATDVFRSNSSAFQAPSLNQPQHRQCTRHLPLLLSVLASEDREFYNFLH
ncbi:hypothetical protein MRBBS_0119 [Marinobacter sp. BSs20148]|nr:hypothetical protein MRBBS_0119 [Marinobacter sp. BSs20148]